VPQILLALQAVCLLMSLAVVFVSMTNWGHTQMRYFTCLSLAAFLLGAGYFLEVTSTSLEAAVVACKVQYLGVPFLGVFCFLFGFDYSDSRLPRPWYTVALLAVSLIMTLLVFTWPAQRLLYADLSFSAEGALPHLTVTPGPLYYAVFLYDYGLTGAGCVVIIRNMIRSGRKKLRHSLHFVIAATIPLAVQLCLLAGLTPAGWDPIPAAVGLAVALLCLHLTRYRAPEWRSLGRELVIQKMNDAFVLIDTDGRFLDANERAAEYFPALRKVGQWTHTAEIEGFPLQLLEVDLDNFEFPHPDKEEVMFLRVSRTPLEARNQILGACIVVYDDTENHKLMLELRKMARHDPLSGLYNRKTFFTDAGINFDLLARDKISGSVLMMDIDYFKRINDSFGHACGDTVIVGIADILRARLRHTDIAGRYGGEELCAWLPHTDTEGAALVAESIRKSVEAATFPSPHGCFNVTISIGVASAGLDYGRSFADLVNEADIALYNAKNSGRNQVSARHGSE
jgi:diguanylate cyclase (GGDEF)-like protein